MTASRSVQLLGLWERHNKLCQSLATPAVRPFAETMLSRWVRPDDRGIPAELVKRTVGSLIRADFNELIEIPGVGVTKLAKLMELLERVGSTALPNGREERGEKAWLPATSGDENSPDSLWSNDVHTIRNADVEDLPLGRMAPTLDELPRNLWLTSLSRFLVLSYDELHSIPYFGVRRISAVREVVSVVARRVRETAPGEGKRVWLVPLIQQAEAGLDRLDALTPDQRRHEILIPLFTQIGIDLGSRAVEVAGVLLGHEAVSAGKILGIGRSDSVAISRPRMHQIREDIRLVFQVRWPEGGRRLEAGLDRIAGTGNGRDTCSFLDDLCNVLYGRRPGRRAHRLLSSPVDSSSLALGR